MTTSLWRALSGVKNLEWPPASGWVEGRGGRVPQAVTRPHPRPPGTLTCTSRSSPPAPARRWRAAWTVAVTVTAAAARSQRVLGPLPPPSGRALAFPPQAWRTGPSWAPLHPESPFRGAAPVRERFRKQTRGYGARFRARRPDRMRSLSPGSRMGPHPTCLGPPLCPPAWTVCSWMPPRGWVPSLAAQTLALVPRSAPSAASIRRRPPHWSYLAKKVPLAGLLRVAWGPCSPRAPAPTG